MLHRSGGGNYGKTILLKLLGVEIEYDLDYYLWYEIVRHYFNYRNYFIVLAKVSEGNAI